MGIINNLRLPQVDETAFNKYYYEQSLSVNRVALVLALILYALFGILDIWAVPMVTHQIWFIRYAIICPFLTINLAATYFKIFHVYYQVFLGLSVLAMAYGILFMILLAQESEMGFRTYYAGLMLVLIGNFVLYRIRFKNSNIVAALILLGYEVIAIAFQDVLKDYSNAIIFINNNFFFLTTIILGLFSNYFIELYMRKDFNNRNNLHQRAIELQNSLDNIRTLKGLLPICATCKKIRDDKGYWNYLEKYIEDYSDASFSHGTCPECADKLYGNEDWYQKMKKKP